MLLKFWFNSIMEGGWITWEISMTAAPRKSSIDTGLTNYGRPNHPQQQWGKRSTDHHCDPVTLQLGEYSWTLTLNLSDQWKAVTALASPGHYLPSPVLCHLLYLFISRSIDLDYLWAQINDHVTSYKSPVQDQLILLHFCIITGRQASASYAEMC